MICAHICIGKRIETVVVRRSESLWDCHAHCCCVQRNHSTYFFLKVKFFYEFSKKFISGLFCRSSFFLMIYAGFVRVQADFTSSTIVSDHFLYTKSAIYDTHKWVCHLCLNDGISWYLTWHFRSEMIFRFSSSRSTRYRSNSFLESNLIHIYKTFFAQYLFLVTLIGTIPFGSNGFIFGL